MACGVSSSYYGGHLVRPDLQALAAAGGTGMPLIWQDNPDLTTRLHEALAEIRGSSLPCELAIPPATGGKIDYEKVNVKWKGTTAPEQTIPYVERADRCEPTRGGWYYDVPPMAGTPSRVIACEASCRQLKADGGTISLAFACATRIE
jgi:hypothetical protein